MVIFLVKKGLYFWLAIFLVGYIFIRYIFVQKMVVFLIVIFFLPIGNISDTDINLLHAIKTTLVQF